LLVTIEKEGISLTILLYTVKFGTTDTVVCSYEKYMSGIKRSIKEENPKYVDG
jgi:hypothetical protein